MKYTPSSFFVKMEGFAAGENFEDGYISKKGLTRSLF